MIIRKIKQKLASRHFLSLLLVKMLIPAMATGGITMEIEATHLLDLASLFDVAHVEAVTAEAEIPGAVVSCSEEQNDIVACTSLPSETSEDVSQTPALHLIRFRQEVNPGNWLESELKLPDLALT